MAASVIRTICRFFQMSHLESKCRQRQARTLADELIAHSVYSAEVLRFGVSRSASGNSACRRETRH
jgi:hypothetical protein